MTESSFFGEATNGMYDEADRMVYSGGGHTVLQFTNAETALAFAKAVSTLALRRYPEMELYLKQTEYDEGLSPEENLTRLTEALERKKAQRCASFRWSSIGVEQLDSENWKPRREISVKDDSTSTDSDLIEPPEGMRFPRDFDELRCENQHDENQHDKNADNFLAVVHIDGNAMGKRVQALLHGVCEWDAACEKLRTFSESVDQDFKAAFSETVLSLLNSKPELLTRDFVPIRPIILAGDDVCFVTAGSIGLECARLFLEHLTAKTNDGDGKGYAACAGIALVHRKYPFHMAYALSEELCSSAKRYGQSLDAESRVSAMDWHIEFGQLKESLRSIREDYVTEDGNHLELRPVYLKLPEECRQGKPELLRSYSYFRCLCGALKKEYGKTARGKLKNLRTALKQGEIETRFYLADKQVSDLLYHPFDAAFPNPDARWEELRQMLLQGKKAEKKAFSSLGNEAWKRSLFFDALEMMDHFETLEEVEG